MQVFFFTNPVSSFFETGFFLYRAKAYCIKIRKMPHGRVGANQAEIVLIVENGHDFRLIRPYVTISFFDEEKKTEEVKKLPLRRVPIPQYISRPVFARRASMAASRDNCWRRGSFS